MNTKAMLAKLKKKRNWGKECECDDPDEYDYIHYGAWKEVMTVCKKCGGYITGEEVL